MVRARFVIPPSFPSVLRYFIVNRLQRNAQGDMPGYEDNYRAIKAITCVLYGTCNLSLPGIILVQAGLGLPPRKSRFVILLRCGWWLLLRQPLLKLSGVINSPQTIFNRCIYYHNAWFIYWLRVSEAIFLVLETVIALGLLHNHSSLLSHGIMGNVLFFREGKFIEVHKLRSADKDPIVYCFCMV